MKRTIRSTPSALAIAAAAIAGNACAQGIEPYYGFVHWVSMGDLDRAALQFAPDARVVAGPACLVVAPCIGREAIAQGYLSRLLDRRLPLPLVDQRFDGRALFTRGDMFEARSPGEPAQALRMQHRIGMGAGGITSLQLEFGTDEPATVQWLARRWPQVGAVLP
jgi:hypothetical protein